jgi:hypothetical protein
MNKRHLHHIWTQLRGIRPWYFLLAGAICLVVTVLALRNNYATMVKLRQAVYTADQNNGDVAGTLNSLRDYIYAHMNTNPASGPNAVYPPIQLKYTYERLTEAATQRAAATNQSLYTQAQAYCQQQDSTDFSGRNRVPCIESYVTSHGVKVQPVPDGLYKFAFQSPSWSADLAGWSLLLTIVFFATGIGLWLTELWLRRRVA